MGAWWVSKYHLSPTPPPSLSQKDSGENWEVSWNDWQLLIVVRRTRAAEAEYPSLDYKQELTLYFSSHCCLILDLSQQGNVYDNKNVLYISQGYVKITVVLWSRSIWTRFRLQLGVLTIFLKQFQKFTLLSPDIFFFQ